MIDGALGPDAALVTVNDPGHGRQADARASEVLIPVQAIKGIKELIGIEHIKAGSVISDKPRLLLWVPAQLDDRRVL